jgi:acetylglutamate kinase
VVHGGGPQISRCSQARLSQRVPGGLRVTTPGGDGRGPDGAGRQVGRELVGLINEHGPFAVGCPVRTPGCSPPVRRHGVVDGEPVDIGQVGDVARWTPRPSTT